MSPTHVGVRSAAALSTVLSFSCLELARVQRVPCGGHTTVRLCADQCAGPVAAMARPRGWSAAALRLRGITIEEGASDSVSPPGWLEEAVPGGLCCLQAAGTSRGTCFGARLHASSPVQTSSGRTSCSPLRRLSSVHPYRRRPFRRSSSLVLRHPLRPPTSRRARHSLLQNRRANAGFRRRRSRLRTRHR